MATKNLDAYKLGVVLDASGAAKGIAALNDADKAATKTYSSLTQLSKSFKFGLADKFKSELAEAQKVAGSSRASAVGQQLGSMVGDGIKNGIGSVFTAANLGKLIGTAIAPGIGTVVGGIVGSGVDAALEKISGPLMNQIQRGIELNKQLELAQLHYTAFTGSSAEAERHLASLKKLSVEAGLDLPQLLTADQRLEEFNDNVKLSELELRAAADQAARFGGGVDGFNSIASALGLIAERGELSSKSLLKLYKQGIDAPKLLAQATGLSEKEVKARIKAGHVNGAYAAQAISEGIEVNSGGYAQRVATSTLSGQQARFQALQDSLAQRGTANITQGMKDAYGLGNNILASGMADKTVAFIDRAAGSLKNLIEVAVKTGYNATSGLIEGMLDTGNLGAGVSKFVGKFTDALTSTAGFDINSPSKKMIPVGEDAAEGVVVGFENYMAGEGAQRLTATITETVRQAQNRQRLNNLAQREPDFLPTLEREAAKRNMNPDDILNLLAIESGFNKSVTNKFGYSGLGQLGRNERASLGLPSSDAAARNLFASKSAAWQLVNAVFPLIDQKNRAAIRSGVGPLDDLSKLYAAWGAGHAERDPNAVMAVRGGKRAGMYANNPLWDYNHDGVIRQYEFGQAARAALGAGTNFTVSGIPVSASNPVPVQMMGDLTGSVGVLAGDTFNPSRAPSVLNQFRQTLKDTVPVVVDVTEKQDALEQTTGVTATQLFLFNKTLLPVPSVLDASAKATNAFSMSQEEYAKKIFGGASKISQAITNIAGALGEISGLMPSGGQVGKKRGFFSKLLGFAAPFLSFIPGVGPILSTLAGMGSNALAGNWGGVVSGLAGGLQPGGVFRGKPSANTPAPALGDVSVSGANGGDTSMPHRATGGPVRRGRAYVVGEYRNEVFEPNEDGWIHPSVDSYLAGMRGVPRTGGDFGAVLSRLEAHFARLDAYPPEYVFATGAQRNPGAVTDAFMTHGSRDPRVIEWMSRRVAGI
ncbi:MAG TPA: tape measure protein [Pyrinomonadaceae bacterium]|nr:tape measure protein [Pyrinomonadaceae bacterium]